MNQALFALFADDSPSAKTLVSRTQELGIDEPDLKAIESVLQAHIDDPSLIDLSHPRTVVRREAIASILQEVEAGKRPAFDLMWIEGALRDEEPSVRIEAIAAMERGGSSAPLLAAFPMGQGLPVLDLDGSTFLALARTLFNIADGPAMAVLQNWNFEDFARLDMETGESTLWLPPNLRIFLTPRHSREFAPVWIRGQSRINGSVLLELSEKLEGGDTRLVQLAGEIIDSLAALDTPEGIRALGKLAAALHLNHGPEIIDRLSRLGASEELLSLIRKPLPGSLRALATKALGRSLEMAQRSERSNATFILAELLRRDPHPEVRLAALRVLTKLGKEVDARMVMPALFDHALREEALEFLEQRPLPEALPVLLDLLKRGDSQLRCRIADAVGATRNPEALVPLAALLIEKEPDVRFHALKAMRAISISRALILAAGLLPPGSGPLQEMALEVARGSHAAESPDLLFLAMKVSLGLHGAPSTPLALQEASRALLREPLQGKGRTTSFPVPPRVERILNAKR